MLQGTQSAGPTLFFLGGVDGYRFHKEVQFFVHPSGRLFGQQLCESRRYGLSIVLFDFLEEFLIFNSLFQKPSNKAVTGTGVGWRQDERFVNPAGASNGGVEVILIVRGYDENEPLLFTVLLQRLEFGQHAGDEEAKHGDAALCLLILAIAKDF